MFISFTKESIFVFCLTLFISTAAFSQSYQYEDYRRFSILLSGGAILGDANNSSTLLSSNFSINTDISPTFDAGIQYALTPAWSLELGYRRTQIVGTDKPFETNMNMIILKNVINLNQVFFVNRISTRLNPFLTAGIGYDMFNYDGPNEKFYDHNSNYNAGIGIAYKLTNAIDIFTHYEYRLGANTVDNVRDGWGSDLRNSLTGGFRINLGNKNTPHLSWRPAPVELSPADYNEFKAQNKQIEDLSQKMSQIEEQNEATRQRYEQLIEKNATEIDSLKNRLGRLENRVANLKDAFAEMQEEIKNVKVNQETGMAASLPSGHYTQIFASYNLNTAQSVRDHALENLDEALQDAQNKVFIIKRKQFYEVLIGVFNEFQHSKEIQKIMTDVHDDAYVITFPRPLNLKPDFEGLRILEKN